MKLKYLGREGLNNTMAQEKHCPLCDRTWTPSPLDDCFMPSCGCYGNDLSARELPCDRCGMNHIFSCAKGPIKQPTCDKTIDDWEY